MSVTSLTVPFKTKEKLILERTLRSFLINYINSVVMTTTGQYPDTLTLRDRVVKAFSNFLTPDAIIVGDEIVFLRLPSNMPFYLSLKEFADIIGGTYIEQYEAVHISIDKFVEFLSYDLDLLKQVLGK